MPVNRPIPFESLQNPMKPRASHQDDRQGDMFRTELADIIDLHHALVLLAGRIDWAFFEREFSAPFSETTGGAGQTGAADGWAAHPQAGP